MTLYANLCFRVTLIFLLFSLPVILGLGASACFFLHRPWAGHFLLALSVIAVYLVYLRKW